MRRFHTPIGILVVLLASLVFVPASLAAKTHPGHAVKRSSTHHTRATAVATTTSSRATARDKTVKATKGHATVKATPSAKASKATPSVKTVKATPSVKTVKATPSVKTVAATATKAAGTAAATSSPVASTLAATVASLASSTTSAGARTTISSASTTVSSLVGTVASITSPSAASTATSSPAATDAAVNSPATTSAPATTSTPATTGAAAATTSAAPVLGTFDISTAAQASAWKAAGGNAIIIPVYWDQAQPTQTGGVSLADAGNSGDNVISEIQLAHQDGLAVYLELDLQYPPQWVLNGVPEFVDQGGNHWAQPTNPGADVRDWIWTAVGRQAVANFVSGALSDLAPYLGDVAGFRSGGGVYGELDFPNDNSTVNGEPSFWGYDAAAQTGAGLAAGESATPLPGYVYGSGTAAQDTEWANWYLGSLASWITWYTQLLRSDGWTGPTYVLSPSFGMRTNMTPDSTVYEQQLAYGTDWGVMMDSYDQVPNVWPWSTWTDDTEPYWHTGDTVDSDAAAWRKLLELAQARGLASHIMGENTGGGGAPAIHQMMSGALASGYTGIFYLDYPTLTTTGLTSYLVSQFNTYAQ